MFFNDLCKKSSFGGFLGIIGGKQLTYYYTLKCTGVARCDPSSYSGEKRRGTGPWITQL
jgi:hypothetical protein